MADNVVITPGVGETIGADEISGVKYQRVKLIYGADGANSGDVSSANPLPTVPVNSEGVQPYGTLANLFYGVSASDIVTTNSTQVVAAGGAGVRYYITSISVSNMDATVNTRVDILDGATVIWSGPAACLGGGFVQTFPAPLRGTANTAINAQCSTTSAQVRVAVAGFKASV